MIISASRRTDIPAFYAEWLINRLEEGFVLVPSPKIPERLGHIELSPANVDCIVFWTKNPRPMLDKLDRLDDMGFPYYFQFTLTPYSRDIEGGLPEKTELVKTFQALSGHIGPERLVWRYDPIFTDKNHSASWQMESFSRLCEALHPYTKRCIISFIDIYPNNGALYRTMTEKEIYRIADGFSQTAAKYGLALFTCAEKISLDSFGIGHAACIDPHMIERILGCPITSKKDTNQRPACGCAESVDIGVYGTCVHDCTYCYAASGKRGAVHDPKSPMLTGWPRGDEIITNRTLPSQKVTQISLF